MPYGDLNGAHINYTDTGEDGPPIVFSHGLLFSGAMFDDQVAHLRSKYRSITFDHRGQGQSGVTHSDYDMDTLSADATALIINLKATPCHFVGLRLAAQQPTLMKTLTLFDTSADPDR